MHLQSQDSPARTGDTLPARLYRALFAVSPPRASLMTNHGQPKYRDAPKGHTFSPADIADHLDGARTGGSLRATNDTARVGCRDYDAGGAAVVEQALHAAQQAGIVAFGIVVEGTDNEHTGGHVWAFHQADAPAADIRAQLGTLPGAKGEVYPSGNAIRLPGGYHRTTRTFGTLLLQDGRCFDLNDAAQRTAGLRAMLALPRNAAPPSAPVGARGSTGGAFGVSRSEDWQHLPDGARLMASPRYRAIFAARRQLATLQRGERVTLYRDGAPDDTGSAQVAALVFNLITSQRKGEKPGVGAPPEAEIRAVALHWKKALRDNRSDAHYRAQIDYEIARYRPATYAPEATHGYTLSIPATDPLHLLRHSTEGDQQASAPNKPSDWLASSTICPSMLTACDARPQRD